MLDAKFIRNNPDLIKDSLKKRNDSFDLDSFLTTEDNRRKLLVRIEELTAKQNKIAKEIQLIVKEKQSPQDKIAESKVIKQNLEELNQEFGILDSEYNRLLLWIPNLVDSSLPVGDQKSNKIVRHWGDLPSFDFKPKDHLSLSEHLDIVDFKRGAKLTGSNFVLFKGQGARLERALINFMLDLHSLEHGYTEVSPPFVVNSQSMTATGQLPKLKNDMYQLNDEEFFLIPTAEVPVTNLHRKEVVGEDELPMKYVAYTPCFRREAGSYGKDTKGLMRLHQFDKVELVKFVHPERSYDELEMLLQDACSVLERLNIPYRVVLLATGDISFAAAKCYDIEIYAPGIDTWLEVSSCSNFEDFQARRGNIKYRDKKSDKQQYLHTINGSGVALPRLVTVILEQYQRSDGSIVIPEALRPYMAGREIIEK
ncbi:MAG: serine--tRNA ligase [Candidatus Omnitrophica bacterium]|nr:serine--tRNA ligase [Candidatus Omnitrophota bacterium]